MRLLHVTHQYQPAIGGAEKYITDLSEELARRGHAVDVFTHRSTSDNWRNILPGFEEIKGVKVYRFRSLPRTAWMWWLMHFGFRHYWRTRHRYYEPCIFLGSGPISLSLFDAILREAHRYDLIHINQLHYSHSYPTYLAARWRRLPMVITPHLHAEQPQTYDVGYMRTVLRGSDTILTVTTSEKEHLSQAGYTNDIVVGGNGLHIADFPPLDKAASRARLKIPPKAFVMLFLGRKMEYKGIGQCLEAFCQLRQRRTDIHFLAVGPETDFSAQLWAEHQGMTGLTVLGRVTNEERLAALAACDLLVMPSVGEAFGIVYLEGWAYHQPVIGARIDSVSSLIRHGQDGFLVDPPSVSQLAHYLAYLADHPEMARTMGHRGYQKLVSRYTVQHIANIVEGAYWRLLRRQRNLALPFLKQNPGL